MQMLGPLSVPGQLRLTDRSISFIPNRLNRLFGLKECTISLGDIDEVNIVGIDRALQIDAGGTVLKFHGKWARTIHERLVPTLDAGTMEMKALLRERILVQGSAEYYPSSVVAVVGSATVTSRTVRFEPRDLERLVYRSSELSIPINIR